LIRMRELAVQASTGSLNSQDRVNIQQEYGANLLEMVRVTNSVNFNGIDLLKGSATLSFQVGTGTGANDKIEVDFGQADPTSLGIAGSYVNDVTNAQAGITALDNAIKTVSGVRAKFGAGMNRLTSTVSTLQLMQANTSASLSRIQDTDVALETASLSRNQVLSQAGTAVLAQANQTSQVAMTLLRG